MLSLGLSLTSTSVLGGETPPMTNEIIWGASNEFVWGSANTLTWGT